MGGVVRRLEPHFVEKVWGSTDLAPWFANEQHKQIGEVWFGADDNDSPLLIKFLFTTEPLSVQVHPDDAYAGEHEKSRGKTEMWHILRAVRGAVVAMGFRRELSEQELRESAATGGIQALLNWIEVKSGDTLFTPAGTVHAIGAGIALCEIQQRSDVTYRLYDYGRPRELHIEQSVAVADRGVFVNQAKRETVSDELTSLVDSPFFVTREFRLDGAMELQSVLGDSETVVVLEGRGTIAGERFQAGEAWRIAPRQLPLEIASNGPVVLLQTYRPS